jgi:hypothetical protein
MATRSLRIGKDPVDLQAQLSLQDGMKYLLQHVAGEARLYLKELPDGEAVDRTQPAHFALVGQRWPLLPEAGQTIWAWSNTTSIYVVVTEAE